MPKQLIHSYPMTPFLESNNGDGGGTGAGSSQGDAGASTNASQQSQAGAGDQSTRNDQQGSPQPEQQQRSTSANQLIKDFAKERGITVEELIGKFTELENAGKTELQRRDDEIAKLNKQVEQLTSSNRDLSARQAVTAAAGTAKAIDSDAVYALIAGKLEYDPKTGAPTNVGEALDELRTAKPHLFRYAEGRGDGGRQGAESTGDINDALRELARGGT
jgi:hypothetical protein